MQIQHLNYLAALARERHFARAAEACHVSQPTLSEGIRRLERELGVPLVRRGRRFEGLTPEGERMLEWAKRVVADVDGMRDDLAAMRDGLSGRLRLGAIPTSLPIVSLLTGRLRRLYPAVHVRVVSLPHGPIEHRLHNFELDAGLTYLENEPLRELRSLPLYDERYLLLTRADGPHGDADEVRWADAAQEPLCLLTPENQNRRIIDSTFAEVLGSAPRPVVDTNSLSTLYSHVRDGLASAVMAHTWLHVFAVPEGMRAIPLVEPEISHVVGAVWLDRDPEPLLARAFLAAAREAPLEPAIGRA